MTNLPPWTAGPFELLLHAEGHLRRGEDFDRRIALISFDNAIEVAITTYLTLHPIQRGNRAYPRADVETWLQNYHSKLDFLDSEITTRMAAWQVERSYIIWAHDNRNEQYHGGSAGTPEKHVLVVARSAALWVFGFLFEISDVETILESALASPLPETPDPRFDAAIDQAFDMVRIEDGLYYPSEVLFAVDKVAYRTLGGRLNLPSETPSADTAKSE